MHRIERIRAKSFEIDWRPKSGVRRLLQPKLVRSMSRLAPIANLQTCLGFDAVRQRVALEWESLPRTAQVYSDSLQEKVARISKQHSANGDRQTQQEQDA